MRVLCANTAVLPRPTATPTPFGPLRLPMLSSVFLPFSDHFCPISPPVPPHSSPISISFPAQFRTIFLPCSPHSPFPSHQPPLARTHTPHPPPLTFLPFPSHWAPRVPPLFPSPFSRTVGQGARAPGVRVQRSACGTDALLDNNARPCPPLLTPIPARPPSFASHSGLTEPWQRAAGTRSAPALHCGARKVRERSGQAFA